MDDLVTRIAQGEPDALAEGLARADLLNAAILTAPDDELRWNALNADLSIVAARAASSDLLEPVEIGVPIGAPDLVALVQLLEHLHIGLGRWALHAHKPDDVREVRQHVRDALALLEDRP